jgi:hypothetical protein
MLSLGVEMECIPSGTRKLLWAVKWWNSRIMDLMFCSKHNIIHSYRLPFEILFTDSKQILESKWSTRCFWEYKYFDIFCQTVFGFFTNIYTLDLLSHEHIQTHTRTTDANIKHRNITYTRQESTQMAITSPDGLRDYLQPDKHRTWYCCNCEYWFPGQGTANNGLKTHCTHCGVERCDNCTTIPRNPW